QKRNDLVKTHVERAMTASPADPEVLLLAARAYMGMGDAASAEHVLQKALQISPNALDAYSLLGRIYAAQRRLPDAIMQFQQLAERQPKAVSAHTAVGV